MLKIVIAEESDLPDTARLFARVLREIPYYNALAKEGEAKKYTATTLARKLSEDPYSILVARNGDRKIVGFCISHFDDYTIWVDWYGVDTTRRRNGVGTALLKKTIQTATKRGAHKVWCDTRTINEPSKDLLQKMGFTRLVEIKNHWYGQDFILWERFVDP
ncbi:MAG: GNAT family N-acetyltransferase [Thaumarchaeota archaeon]|nr:GNAT family N-acetyltransferase [Nitrososphaerota archaeon]